MLKSTDNTGWKLQTLLYAENHKYYMLEITNTTCWKSQTIQAGNYKLYYMLEYEDKVYGRAEEEPRRDPSAYQPNALPLGQTGSRVADCLQFTFKPFS